MRQLCLIFALLLATQLNAASWTAVTGGGPWNTNATWGGTGHPVAGDTANISGAMTSPVTLDGADACGQLIISGSGPTLTFTASDTLTVSAGVTLGGTLAGTGTLSVTGGTFTSNSITLPCALSIGGSFTIGAQNLTVTGLTTTVSNRTIYSLSSTGIICNGGLTQGGTLAGAAFITVGGGTWSGNYGNTISTFTLSGCGISGSVQYTGTAFAVSGTISGASTPALTLANSAMGITCTSTATLQCAVSFNLTAVYTFNGSLVTTGLTTIGTAATFTQTVAETYTTAGITMTGTLGGTVPIVFTTGNWAGTSVLSNSWSIATGQTLTLTVNTQAANWPTANAGVLAFSSKTLTITGASQTINLYGTNSSWTATSGGLNLTGATPTLTANSVTFPGTLTFNYVGGTTITLSNAGNTWTNTGVVTVSTATVATVLNWTTAETITCNGGINLAAAISGTATIILGGGSWSGTYQISNNLTINCATLTIAPIGNVTYGGNTITYTAGTVTMGSTRYLVVGNATTFNTSGMSWANISVSATTAITLTSDLVVTGLFAGPSNGTITFTGAYNIYVGTLVQGNSVNAQSFIYPAGQTLFISTGITLISNSSTTIKSATGGSPVYINYSGSPSLQTVVRVIFTDVQSVGKPILNFQGTAGMLTGSTSGIINFDPSKCFDIYSGGIQP